MLAAACTFVAGSEYDVKAAAQAKSLGVFASGVRAYVSRQRVTIDVYYAARLVYDISPLAEIPDDKRYLDAVIAVL